ncbi:MAG: hypothetical protein KAT32_01300 [Candidatus Moranbacteria bacterium]|nr:hypothetical protein [Candidatus Moranbacteria bacterium]
MSIEFYVLLFIFGYVLWSFKKPLGKFEEDFNYLKSRVDYLEEEVNIEETLKAHKESIVDLRNRISSLEKK